MTDVQNLATFAVQSTYTDLSVEARHHIKIRILDALGCALGAQAGPPIAILRAQLADFGGNPLTTLIGGGKTAPDRAALYNAALVRYLDFNDSYLAQGETCHPSDNLGGVLAACEYAGGTGKDLMTALALAYQVQCRLSDVAPVRAKGFDHTTQGAYAAAAGVAKALGCDTRQMANAIAISGTAQNALRVTRTGNLSQWKGMAYPNTVFVATHAAFLALRGMTGPEAVFEGNKGLMDAITGPFQLDWSREDLEIVQRTSIKKYNAEFHSQSALEGILELRARGNIQPANIAHVTVDTFDVAFDIIGGGEEGDKRHIHTKEEADHSLPYMLAVALLDGEVTPAQYAPERIVRDDVQHLLRAITIRPNAALSRRFPAEMPCHISIQLTDGREFRIEKADYAGFYTRPCTWEQAAAKFTGLAEPFVGSTTTASLIALIANLEEISVRDLTTVLGAAEHAAH
ncbi:MAG: MmgE/PrpD family protein [Ktedonobacterales bacterium]|nr:MmgE/PrpD family protein [Ktedonobacterales bacterium]